MNVWLLCCVAGTGVKTHVAETVHDDPIDEVDGLTGPGKIHLGPVILARRAVDVAWRGSRLNSSVPRIQCWLTDTIKVSH